LRDVPYFGANFTSGPQSRSWLTVAIVNYLWGEKVNHGAEKFESVIVGKRHE